MYDKITGHLRWFSSKCGQITNISNITPGEKMFKNSCRFRRACKCNNRFFNINLFFSFYLNFFLSLRIKLKGKLVHENCNRWQPHRFTSEIELYLLFG